jgi:hypothetical protein
MAEIRKLIKADPDAPDSLTRAPSRELLDRKVKMFLDLCFEDIYQSLIENLDCQIRIIFTLSPKKQQIRWRIEYLTPSVTFSMDTAETLRKPMILTKRFRTLSGSERLAQMGKLRSVLERLMFNMLLISSINVGERDSLNLEVHTVGLKPTGAKQYMSSGIPSLSS